MQVMCQIKRKIFGKKYFVDCFILGQDDLFTRKLHVVTKEVMHCRGVEEYMKGKTKRIHKLNIKVNYVFDQNICELFPM